MKKLIFIILTISLDSPTWSSVPPCTTIDTTELTQDQINSVPAIAYELGYSVDPTAEPPTISRSGNQEMVCFLNPAFDPTTIITTTTLLAQFQSDQSARDYQADQALAWQVELSTISALAQNAYQNWDSLTAAQKDDLLKYGTRIVQLRQLLGLP